MSDTMNWERNRNVTERWIIEGQLELVTPTSLSNGDEDPLVDLPVVVDPLEGVALLTGASLAGALRSYLDDFGQSYAVDLFGGARGNEDGAQSSLIVEDALGDQPLIELRDGVSIEATTRTAKDREKYDRQLLAAGTTFEIGFELVVTSRDGDAKNLKAALAQALCGLQDGEIRLGGRKRRGYGQCRVNSWRAWRYDLTEAEGLRTWLVHDREGFETHQAEPWTWTRNGQSKDDGILSWPSLDGVTRPKDERDLFTLKATFAIDDSVLIRSGFETESGPDAVHLRSTRPDHDEPVAIMSGTSLAGVMRGHALRVARTVAGPDHAAEAKATVDKLFGVMEKPKQGMTPAERRELKKLASRVTVDESVIDGQKDIVQSRVKIDRFTGGAYESALFAEQPAFGGEFELRLSVREAQAAEVGLLLLVLKDLWTGFTPVGGGSSVGRGRLTGKEATIRLGDRTWKLEAEGDGVLVTEGKPSELNDFVSGTETEPGLVAFVRGGGKNGQ